jgi:hypothetical protein
MNSKSCHQHQLQDPYVSHANVLSLHNLKSPNKCSGKKKKKSPTHCLYESTIESLKKKKKKEEEEN